MCYDVVEDNVVYDFIGNRSEGDGFVVRGKWFVFFFEDGVYVSIFLVLRDVFDL